MQKRTNNSRGIHWGSRKENGIFLVNFSHGRRKVLFGGGDRLIYISIWRLRIRIMKPHFFKEDRG